MEKVLESIEKAALTLVSLDETDIPELGMLHDLFMQVQSRVNKIENLPESIPEVIGSVSTNLAGWIEKIILQEINDTHEIITSINQAVDVLQNYVQNISDGNQPGLVHFPEILQIPLTDNISAPSISSNSEFILPENVDEEIFQEYITAQPDVLESLEESILAMEKENTEDALSVVKGILHSMKGEAGLMGLTTIANACHESENTIEASDKFPAEKLLETKDWMESSFCQISGKTPRTVQPEEETIEESNPSQIPEPVSSEPSTSNESTSDEENSSDDLVIAESDVPLAMDFICEANEHLDSSEANLLIIEENPEDTETINAIFRSFHTIKGVAGFLNLQQIRSLAHVAENLLDLARKGECRLEGPRIDIIFEASDVMQKMIDALKEAIENDQAIAVYPNLSDLIDRIKLCIDGQEPTPRVGEILVENTQVKPSQVREAVKEQKSGQAEGRVGEILVEKQQATSKQVDKALKKQNEPTSQKSNKKVTSDNTVRVTTSRLDAMVDMVGELVIAQSMVSQDLNEYYTSNDRLERNVRHLDKITRDLQDLSMSMRMVPVHGVFQKIARLVRDLSKKTGKLIDLEMSGAETEMDRNVVEAIADPLVHMIRNSIDHGIETPEEREKTPKDATGSIALKAYHMAGNIVIEIADDGRGLDRDKLFDKALNKGIVQEGQELSDQEVYQLIFHPGFSTAEKVTDISGRGVGMDVVRKNIESLRGRIEIDSELGKGTVFKLKLPLTLAVIDGQIVTINQQRFIIPTISIEQSTKPIKGQISTVQGKGEMMMIRGELIPFIRLYELFDVEPMTQNPEEALAVIVGDGSDRCCLMVDTLLGQQQVVIKSLGDFFGAIKGVSGGAIMGDGNISLILDVLGIMKLASEA